MYYSIVQYLYLQYTQIRQIFTFNSVRVVLKGII